MVTQNLYYTNRYVKTLIVQRSVWVIAASMALGLLTSAVPARVMAAPAQSANCTTTDGKPGTYTSIPFTGNHCVAIGGDLQNNGIIQVLKAVLGFLAGGIGIAVVGGIVYGGFLFMTARGNAAQVQQGETVIRDAVIGLLAFLGMAAVLNFIIPGGILG